MTSGVYVMVCILVLPQAHYRHGNEVMAAMFCLEIAHRLKVRQQGLFVYLLFVVILLLFSLCI